MSGVISVGSAAALHDALRNVSGGETIVLAEGEYGKLSTSLQKLDLSGLNGTLTIRSENPDRPAVFSEIFLRNANGIVFEDISVTYAAQAGDPVHTGLAYVFSSQDIAFNRVSFTGSDAISGDPAANGFPSGFGLRVVGSDGVAVTDSLFQTLWTGVHFTNSSNILLRGTEITDFRSDGLNLTNVQDVLVESNYIHDARRSYTSGDHSDMIQMWSTATDPAAVSRNVTIRDNILDMGEGGWTQSIFITNTPVSHDGRGAAYRYSDITIENNLIINDHIHGITVGASDGLRVASNTLIHKIDDQAPDSLGIAPRINMSAESANVVVADNVAHHMSLPDETGTWIVTGNRMIQNANPDAPDHYTDHFVDAAAEVLEGYQWRPDSDILLSDVGALVPVPWTGSLATAVEANLPAPIIPTPDPDMNLNGGWSDEVLTGGSGDDTILMRYGSDTATGGAGADTFLFDWRYVRTGDHHVVTDLDFAAGDRFMVRFFEGQNILVSSAADLTTFMARSDVTASSTATGLDLRVQDSAGTALEFTLNGFQAVPAQDLPAPIIPTSDPARNLNGGWSDDVLTGGSGDDTILMRYGSDTATGGAGADTFLFDWRYVRTGDHHVVTDLDFAAGDRFMVRFFEGQNILVSSAADLAAFRARPDVTATSTATGLDLRVKDSTGTALDFTLNGIYGDILA